MKITLEELAVLVGGEIVRGDGALVVSGFSTIQEAEEGDITFLGNARYAPQLKKSRASVVLVDANFQDFPDSMAVVQVGNPTLQFGLIVKQFGPQPRPFVAGIHESASIHESVQIDGARSYVGPNAVVEEGVVVGNGSAIHAGAFVGFGSSLGEGCVIHANAVIKDRSLLGNRVIIHSGSVIGSDGFGYEHVAGKHVKIDQVGIVQIDDDVEIGSCTTIDRSRFGRTWIGEGTKIDNLVQIAHNCVIGRHCIIVSQVGISGSTRLGDYVTLAGQVGVAGHLNIGDKTTFLAKSGLTKDYPEPGAYTGYPAKPLLEGRRMLTYPMKVPELLQRVRDLEKKLKEMEARLEKITS
ncbi:UDP-3-O-(3-hydroxymyristoyl)glucosamine N-acyltransferase [Phragmitibacter flavus]|uniref:UDP-3-O-(3-hydroxymyristoyl)glucosamine N-acyltransferase n=1 Tax=Phragmitibacter flavus TaxID=2576071 RepID=UPI00140B577D|nr:UDP-3-O-(3-hydroxymyristoyl)glucosamine N-acyltransferase [Phragmitibacter flavus]